MPRVEAADHVALRRDDLADGHDLPLHVEKRPQLRLGRVLQDGALEIVDRIVEVGKHREERVDQGVHDQVEDDDLRRGCLRGVVGSDAVAHRRQRRAVALMEADDELIGDEAVHLGHVLAVGGHAEGDDVDEVVVVIDAGPLAESLYCLHRHGVEVEGVDQQSRDIVVGSRVVDVEIEPEKCASGRCLFDPLPGCVRGYSVLRESALHAQGYSHAQEADGPWSGPGGEFVPGSAARRSIRGGHFGRRRTKAPLQVGQPVTDYRQLLA